MSRSLATGWWLLTLVVSTIIGYVGRTRGRRAAIALMSGGATLVGACLTIFLIAYGVSRHSRNDGSDILFIVAVFAAIGTFVALIVFLIAWNMGEGTAGAAPEPIIPTLPPRPLDPQTPKPGSTS